MQAAIVRLLRRVWPPSRIKPSRTEGESLPQPGGEIYTLVNKDTREMKFDRDVGVSSSDLSGNRRDTRLR